MPKLTAASVERLKPTDRRQEIADGLLPSLYLIVQPTGRKTWQVRYRAGKTHRRMKLGGYPLLSLAEAREKAREVLGRVQEGEDPSAARRQARAKREEAFARDSIRALVELHDKRHLSTLRSGPTVKRELDRHVVARWGDRDIHSITKRDLIDLLDELVDSGRGTTANRVRGYLGKFFSWCVERDVLQASPMVGVKRPVKERSRDRVLSDDEIRYFWQACERVGWPWDAPAKLLLLTGQRLGEVIGMRDAEIEGGLWTLPGSRVKNGRLHTVPLSTTALDVIASHERRKSAAGLLFTTTGETPLSGFDKARRHLAEAMLAVAEEEHGKPIEIEHWTLHDLRRTAATNMARIGIPVRVTEAVLNHVAGSAAGIVGVYQRHDYADEKREALQAWASLLDEILGRRADNVVRLQDATK